MPFELEKWLALTEQAKNNPKVGDRFSEMYSFWVYVLLVKENLVVTMESNHNKESDWELKVYTTEGWKKEHSYGSIPGWSIAYCDNDENAAKNANEWILGLLEDEDQFVDQPITKVLLKAFITGK
jgi:hypothetical protein